MWDRRCGGFEMAPGSPSQTSLPSHEQSSKHRIYCTHSLSVPCPPLPSTHFLSTITHPIDNITFHCIRLYSPSLLPMPPITSSLSLYLLSPCHLLHPSFPLTHPNASFANKAILACTSCPSTSAVGSASAYPRA